MRGMEKYISLPDTHNRRTRFSSVSGRWTDGLPIHIASIATYFVQAE